MKHVITFQPKTDIGSLTEPLASEQAAFDYLDKHLISSEWKNAHDVWIDVLKDGEVVRRIEIEEPEEVDVPEELAALGHRIFVDMDGVLVDFDKQFAQYLKHNAGEDVDTATQYETANGKDRFQALVLEWGEEYWSTMDWMPDGKQLWDYVSGMNPTILSAPSRFKEVSVPGKEKWLKTHLSDLPNHDIQTKCRRGWDKKSKVILNNMKHRYVASTNDILIDDKLSNIELWRKAGGIGILHTSAEDSIAQLKQLGL